MRKILSFLLAVTLFFCLNSCKNEESGTLSEQSDTATGGVGTEEALTITEKQGSYRGEDILVLYVENNTEDEYSVTVRASFFDGEGKKAACAEKTKTVFASVETCYIFRPGVKFDRFEYEISPQKKDAKSDGRIEYAKQVKAGVISGNVDFALVITNSFPDVMMLDGCVILFDNKGEIFGVHEFANATSPGYPDSNHVLFDLDGARSEDETTLPENLEGYLEVAYDFEYSPFRR